MPNALDVAAMRRLDAICTDGATRGGTTWTVLGERPAGCRTCSSAIIDSRLSTLVSRPPSPTRLWISTATSLRRTTRRRVHHEPLAGQEGGAAARRPRLLTRASPTWNALVVVDNFNDGKVFRATERISSSRRHYVRRGCHSGGGTRLWRVLAGLLDRP